MNLLNENELLIRREFEAEQKVNIETEMGVPLVLWTAECQHE